MRLMIRKLFFCNFDFVIIEGNVRRKKVFVHLCHIGHMESNFLALLQFGWIWRQKLRKCNSPQFKFVKLHILRIKIMSREFLFCFCRLFFYISWKSRAPLESLGNQGVSGEFSRFTCRKVTKSINLLVSPPLYPTTHFAAPDHTRSVYIMDLNFFIIHSIMWSCHSLWFWSNPTQANETAGSHVNYLSCLTDVSAVVSSSFGKKSVAIRLLGWSPSVNA